MMSLDVLYDTPKKVERVYNEDDILAPIFRVVYSRRLVFYMAGTPNSRFPMAKLGRQKLPVLVTICDSGASGGPAAWDCAENAIEWAKPWIYVYSGAVLPVLFQIITDDAIDHGRFLLIETVPERENDWRRVLDVPLLPTQSEGQT